MELLAELEQEEKAGLELIAHHVIELLIELLVDLLAELELELEMESKLGSLLEELSVQPKTCLQLASPSS